MSANYETGRTMTPTQLHEWLRMAALYAAEGKSAHAVGNLHLLCCLRDAAEALAAQDRAQTELHYPAPAP